jgi:uncharacterized protein (TIGR02246 family)
MERDAQEIRRVIEEWHRLTRERDLEGVLDLMTDDVVFLRSGAPPMSRSEFAAGFRQWSGRARIESTFELRDLQVSSDLAYAWSFLTVAMTSDDHAETTRREGHVLSVFRKSAAGRWQLARDANLLPAPRQDQEAGSR